MISSQTAAVPSYAAALSTSMTVSTAAPRITPVRRPEDAGLERPVGSDGTQDIPCPEIPAPGTTTDTSTFPG
jgi:hypothetical protein